ncbi:pentapeptide repeat-containing protein [Plantactinospora soyae]|uniref:Pentapeptide repeat-containing protein n=1 Tax=Plantactinospora soyae TaxID=1544732 RepID=A0A927RBH5_9ACTN|nr:pentapeptide repeat-containing protein [Plantactinospora soyae]MBE1491701.1 hypothetical protein [Plantactinospora soyae]
MSVRSSRRAAGRDGVRWRAPVPPRPPSSLELATAEDHDLDHEATFRQLGFFDLDLSGRAADGVEFAQCRFRGADLSGTRLDGATFSDCLFESTNLANLRVEKSSLIRARLATVRMTGVHWINGAVRDTTISQCRLDLSSFRFTDFHRVVFEDCNLARADFQNADLSGVRFTNCDLTGAQFSQAEMAGTRFANCVLAGIGGVTSMAGAVVAEQDLVALSYTLAGALGIQLEGAEDQS